jgi:hypothetical protein
MDPTPQKGGRTFHLFSKFHQGTLDRAKSAFSRRKLAIFIPENVPNHNNVKFEVYFKGATLEGQENI